MANESDKSPHEVQSTAHPQATDNVYITQHFDWDMPLGFKGRWVNALLQLFGQSVRLISPFNTGGMTNTEQRINMYHLLSQVLAFHVPGDVVEIGTHQGSSAVLFELVIQQHDASRELHLYDAFLESSPEDLFASFSKLHLRLPIVCPGLVEKTIPDKLPKQVCFFHIDIGQSKDPELLTSSLRHALQALYPRMAPGAIGLFADYCDPAVYLRPGYHFPRTIRSTRFWHLYPQVKLMCDEFFADKPEKMISLYAGCYSHGFFRKR